MRIYFLSWSDSKIHLTVYRSLFYYEYEVNRLLRNNGTYLTANCYIPEVVVFNTGSA